MKNMVRKINWVALILMLLISSAGTVLAQESDKDWKFGIGLYFWGASFGGESATGSDIDVKLDDILDNLDFAFMGMAEARKNKWLFAADAIYLDLENSATIAPGTEASVELSGWVVTPFVGYNLVNSKILDLNILGGARYLYLKTGLKVGPDSVEDSGDNWDGIIGIRGAVNLSKKWYIPYHLDIGTGDSDVTYQASAGLGYHFKHIDLVATYRYLRWDFDNNKALDNLYFQGPLLGIRFRF